jgi:predicted kinase
MLIVIGGLPGTGKTSLASGLARVLDAMHVSVQTIERAIRVSTSIADAVGSVGYDVAYALAEDNLRLGRSVVADGVNPLAATRARWRAVATRAAVAFVDVEVICSDAVEHRRRVEAGRRDIGRRSVPTSDEIMALQYEPWAGEHTVIDTARRPVDECVIALHALLLARERAVR